MLFISCNSDSNGDFSFHIDSTIKQKIIAHFESSGGTSMYSAEYGNFLDSLRLTVEPKDEMMLHPIFFWLNFQRKSNRQFLYGCAHTQPVYKLYMSDEPKQCIEVPLISGEITLSSLPDSSSKKPIYGYLKFKSQRYYRINGKDYDNEQTEYDGYFIANYRQAIK